MRESRTYGSVRGARDKRASLPLPKRIAAVHLVPIDVVDGARSQQRAALG